MLIGGGNLWKNHETHIHVNTDKNNSLSPRSFFDYARN